MAFEASPFNFEMFLFLDFVFVVEGNVFVFIEFVKNARLDDATMLAKITGEVEY